MCSKIYNNNSRYKILKHDKRHDTENTILTRQAELQYQQSDTKIFQDTKNYTGYETTKNNEGLEAELTMSKNVIFEKNVFKVSITTKK